MEPLKRLWKSVKHFWKEKHITKILLLICLIWLLVTMLYFAYLASRTNVQSLKDGLSQATVIYDKNGNKATAISMNRMNGVTIEELPQHVIDAVIAIEDRRYYEHNGFDLIGMSRALLKNAITGGITGGGSTITQQLTKNALLSPERTYKRKIEELFLAVEIEKTYSKEEILQMYLNQVYFGSGAWGIEQAAKKYFNKSPQDVSLSEAAMLAGLLQAPSALNPYNHYEAAIERKNVVLQVMKEQGMISESQADEAINENLVLEDGGGSTIERDFPYYVDAVLDEAINEYGLTQDEILTRGYQFYTEMDRNLQASLERIYNKSSLFPRASDGISAQSGAVLLNPATGGVLGLVGGHGEHVFRGFNRATHLKAQPGSTLKPLAVYTPALENGYRYDSLLLDKPTSYGDYTPENYSKTYKGEVTMYEAIQESLNIPAVWLLNELGLEKGLQSLRKFGIPLEKEDEYLGIALGGMHKGISPLQLAESYAAFANEGRRNDSHLITKIVGPTGNIIAERTPKTTKVTSKAVANEMTSMLLNVVESGTGQAASIPGVQLAGKSGSTQLPFEDINGTKDQWFVGYTTNLVCSVWLGYDKTDREHYLSRSGSNTVLPIFRGIMEQSIPFIEPGQFDVQSVNARLANKDVNKTEAIRELKDKAEKVEEIVKEESVRWRNVLEEVKEDLGKTKQKITDIIESIQ